MGSVLSGTCSLQSEDSGIPAEERQQRLGDSLLELRRLECQPMPIQPRGVAGGMGEAGAT